MGNATKQNVVALSLNPSRYYAGADGRLYCEIAAQQGCPVPLSAVPVYIGGGTPDQFIQAARTTSSTPGAVSALPQVLVFFVGFERNPVALAERGPQGATQNEPAIVSDGIRDTGVPVSTTASKNGGTLETLDATGRKTIDLRAATDPNMGVQLPAGGRLIVSRNGDFSGRVTLVDELVGYIDDLNAKLNQMAAYLAAVQDIVIPSGAPWTPVTFPDPATYTFGAAALPVSPDAE